MSEREIVRKNGRPVMFLTNSIQYVPIGKKKDPQQYTPNCRIHRGKCRKLRHQ